MKKIKKLLGITMAMVVGCSALVCSGCGNKEGQGNQGDQAQLEAPVVPSYDGQIVQNGGTYGFTSKMAFLGSDVIPTRQYANQAVTYNASTVTLTATVLPENASQAVSWGVEFINPNSTWATGKTVTDYVSVATETEGSNTCEVTCSAPFGEQIKIVCTSLDNPLVSATCTVDFMQTLVGASLQFGEDFPINIGGQTDVVWEINADGVGKGGAAHVTPIKSETYTLAITDEITWDIDLLAPAGVTGDGYSDSVLVLKGKDCFVSPKADITSLCFDYAFMYSCSLSYTQALSMRMYFYSMDSSTVAGYMNAIEDGRLYTLQLNLHCNGVTTSVSSQLVLTGYTNSSPVQSISLSNSNVTF